MASPSLIRGSRTFTPVELAELPLIGLSRESVQYQMINRWFAEGNAACRRIYTCKSMHVASVLAAAGLGIALLPKRVYAEDLRKRKLRALTTNPAFPSMEFFAISSADNRDPFIDEMAELAAEASTFD